MIVLGLRKFWSTVCLKKTRDRPRFSYSKYTYNTNASLYLGLQLPDLLFVDCFLFLSASLGPIRLTSTKGRNIPVVGQTNVLAATTVTQGQYNIITIN